MVDQLTGDVEQYEAFWRALKEISPVPVALEKIEGGAHGYYHLIDKRIAIDEGMSEMQTIKTLIHEIAHAKLHAIDDGAAPEPEQKKDRHTKEVEAESVAYTVCQRYGIETSDYSFGYIAGWSSDKETKELKGSLETIRKTAAEMIESIDEKLKVLLEEREQPASLEATAPDVTETYSLRDDGIPVYTDVANYAYEAGEIDAYRASRDANLACKEAIEAAISENYVDYRLSTRVAVETVLEQFSEERVQCVLANTVQHNLHDGRYHAENKDWAGRISVCEEYSDSFIVSQVHPGLVNLFINQFKDLLPDKAPERSDAASTPTTTPEKTAAPKQRRTSKAKADQEKPSIREQLKASKSQPEKKTPAKEKKTKSKEMEM